MRHRKLHTALRAFADDAAAALAAEVAQGAEVPFELEESGADVDVGVGHGNLRVGVTGEDAAARSLEVGILLQHDRRVRLPQEVRARIGVAIGRGRTRRGRTRSPKAMFSNTLMCRNRA